jgi:hypothetical protein
VEVLNKSGHSDFFPLCKGGLRGIFPIQPGVIENLQKCMFLIIYEHLSPIIKSMVVTDARISPIGAFLLKVAVSRITYNNCQKYVPIGLFIKSPWPPLSKGELMKA